MTRSRLIMISTLILLSVAHIAVASAQTPSPQSGAIFKRAFEKDAYPCKGSLTVEVYPTELYVGDPIYVVYYETNTTDAPYEATDYSSLTVADFNLRTSKWRARQLDELTPLEKTPILRRKGSKYIFPLAKELPPIFERVERDLPTISLAPGQKRVLDLFYLETPPLEGYASSFWREARQASPDGKFECELELALGVRVPLRFKPRPYNEENVLVSAVENYKTDIALIKKDPYEERIFYKKVSHNDLTNGVSYLIRRRLDDYRRMENACEGWFSLPGSRNCGRGSQYPLDESSKQYVKTNVPSALRDEGIFHALKCDVYGAYDETDRAEAIEKILQWISTLPAPQRVVMLRANPYCHLNHQCAPPSGYRELEERLRKYSDTEALDEIFVP